MLITLFTDSSFSARLRRATWAVWFKVNGQTWRYSGPVRATVSQSGDGELSAIANGLALIARELDQACYGAYIIAQTDSQEAISAIRSNKHPRAYAQNVLAEIRRTTNRHNFTIELRHVHGHRSDETPRHAVNTWCDQQCRREMGKLIAQVKPPPDAAPSAEPY